MSTFDTEADSRRPETGPYSLVTTGAAGSSPGPGGGAVDPGGTDLGGGAGRDTGGVNSAAGSAAGIVTIPATLAHAEEPVLGLDDDPWPESGRDLAAMQDVDVDPSPAAGSDSRLDPVHPRLSGWARFESWLEKKFHTNAMLRRLGSRIWLPLAFHSGLTMKKLDSNTFTYILPFRRFNRNMYNAMAGAALVANSEIAAGMFLCSELKGKWTIVCKHLSYRFRRPCFGPAVYKVHPVTGLESLLSTGREFNLDMVLDVLQQVKNHGRQPRVGECKLTFHVTPKDADGNRRFRRRSRHRA